MDAQLTVSGNVGNQIRYHELDGGGGFASFPLAYTPRVKTNGEWSDGPTLWLTVKCWRVLAERVRDSVNRGDAVIVQGRLRSEPWTDDQGARRESLVVEAFVVAHDLRRGTTTFTRPGRGAVESAPLMESDAEAALADLDADGERAHALVAATG